MTVGLLGNPWLDVPSEGDLEVQQLEDFSDIRLKGVCAYCGTAAVSRDHVPSKALLRKPYPPNLPVIWACYNCNNELSADEEYLRLFMHCVLAGTTHPELHADEDVARGLRRHAALRDRIERSRSKQSTLLDGPQHNWIPEMERIDRVVLKNAAGHAYYEFGEPEEGEVRFVGAAPLQAMPEGLRQVFAAREGLIKPGFRSPQSVGHALRNRESISALKSASVWFGNDRETANSSTSDPFPAVRAETGRNGPAFHPVA